MSIVSRIFSSRSSSRINARLAFFMDNLFAIGFGLGLRYVIDNFAHHDLRVTSTLVGLWEGVVTFHFLRKLPRSLDPYIAYATRLFVDFLVTENVTRLILVVVWTGLGMILADIAPAIWYDVGGRRKWRRVRRDLYYMTRSVPRLPPLFPRARVVRFSPPVRPTEISESVNTPSVASPVPKTDAVPPTPAATHPRAPKRPIPGGLPSSIVSETDSETTSALGLRPSASAAGTTHAQYTIRQRATPSDDYGSHTPSTSVDGSNVSSDPSSTSTETVSQAVDISYQEDNEIQALNLDKGKGRDVGDDSSGTPIRSQIQLPPTPSDSYRPHPNRSSFVPTITGMPSIPDFFESGLGSDWENIRREEAEAEQPLPPVEKEIISPPVQPFYPPPSVYEPTPRPETFDRDLWDDVSNAAPPTPFKTAMPPQRPTRPPPTSVIPRSMPVIPQPIKKQKKSQGPAPPPRIPQTPLYGDTWDTEKDQLPPPTPEVLAKTPINNSDLGLNQGSYTPPVKTEHQESELIHQDVADPSASFDDPWNNPSQPPEEIEEQQDAQQTQDQFAVPPTSQPNIKMPYTPQFPTPQVKAEVPLTFQHQSNKVPSTPQPESTTVPPTPQTKPGTVPPTPQQKTSTVLPTPHQKTFSVPPTPPQQPAPVPPMPQPQVGQKTFTPQQQPAPIPPTPHQQPAPVPPTPHQQTTSIPPPPETKPTKVPTTLEHKTSPPPATPQRESSPSLPPTSQQTSSQIPPAAVQQKTTEVPPTTRKPVAPVPPTSLQQPTQTVYPTPKNWAQTLPPSPRQRNQPIPPTSSLRSKTVPSTPRDLNKPIPPTPLDGLTQKIMNIGGGRTAGDVGDSANQRTQQSNEGNVGDLVDLGDGETGGENGNEPAKTEGGGEDNNDGGESSPHTPEDEGFVQVDAENNPLSPASSGYSSVAGVPSEIKERNKQAIIIRAQIEEMNKMIARLKEEKLMAQGKEELDPLSEESVLKEQEIHKAEKSLEKLTKRAQKRYQAAVDSTNQLSLPKNLDLANMTVPNAIARLEDVLGLYFNSDRRNIVLNINTPRGGPGKPLKTAVTKLFEEYGIKSIAKATGMSIALSGKAYIDMVSAFRQKHAKAEDNS